MLYIFETIIYYIIETKCLNISGSCICLQESYFRSEAEEVPVYVCVSTAGLHMYDIPHDNFKGGKENVRRIKKTTKRIG